MISNLVKRLRNKDPRSVSKAISLIENQDNQYLELLSEIYPYTGNAYRIGITGPPGSGKSSITDKLVSIINDKNLSVAIIAIDPSSPFNGGAILGDRVRFINDFIGKDVFFRSMSTRGSQGGLSKSAKLVADIFDACGYDIIIFETVGVGQIEIDVIEAVDTVVLTLVPESGDGIQMMKSGIMEIADLYAINKADREGVDILYTALNKILQLNSSNVWLPKIIKTIATTGSGIDELYNNIIEHQKFLNSSKIIKKKLDDRYVKIVKYLISEKLMKVFWLDKNRDAEKKISQELKIDYQKRLSPYEIAKKLLD